MFPKDGINDLFIKIKGLDNLQNRKVVPNTQVCLEVLGIKRTVSLFL